MILEGSGEFDHSGSEPKTPPLLENPPLVKRISDLEIWNLGSGRLRRPKFFSFRGYTVDFPSISTSKYPKFSRLRRAIFLLFRGIQRQIWLEAGAEGARKFWFSGRIKGGLERKQRAAGARKKWGLRGCRCAAGGPKSSKSAQNPQI